MKTEGKVWIFADAKTSKKTKPLSLVQAQMHILKLRKKDFNSTLIWTPGWQNWVTLQGFLQTDQTFFVMRQPSLSEKDELPRTSEDSQITKTKSKQKTKSKVSKSSDESIVPDFPKKMDSYTLVDLGEKSNKEEYGYYYDQFNGDDLTLSGEEKNPKPQIKLAKKDQEKQKRTAEDLMERRKERRLDFKMEVFLINQKSSFKSYSENISLHGTRLEDEIPRSFLNEPFDLLIINKLDPNPKTARLLFKARIVGDLSDPRRLNFQSTEPEMLERLKNLLNSYISFYHMQKKNEAS